MVRKKIKGKIKKAVEELQKEGIFPKVEIPDTEVEKPENESYGDYSTNIAMRISKLVKKNPLEVASNLLSKLDSGISKIYERVDIVKPGFINFFVSDDYLKSQLLDILKKKSSFFKLNLGKEKKIQVEFISANPTGPLTLGNGRGGFCGDVLANVLARVGYKVEREYYINDTGEQIKKLGHSVIGDAQAVYKGEYIDSLRKRVKGRDPDDVGEKAARIILEEMIKPTVKKMGIRFDVWFSEKELHKNKEIDKSLDALRRKNLVYKKDGALWFKTKQFGDDKDRVLIRENGKNTYLASDVAYLINKVKRGFKKIIYFWGADHYGYIGRMKAAAEALGYGKERIEIIIMQMVRLIKDGKEFKMAKRKGLYVTMDDLLKDINLDVARFFFLVRKPESHLNFNLDLAKEQSERNPVYYIQYAYARICSILKKVGIKGGKQNIKKEDLKLLTHPVEIKLIKQLVSFPEIVEDTANDFQVQRIPKYAVDIATTFHQFYTNCKVLSEKDNVKKARLSLIKATKIVLEEAFYLMGISAPEKM